MEPNVSKLTLSSKIVAQIEQRKLGNRHRVDHGGTLCSKCYEVPPLPSHKYCQACKNNYNREWMRKRALKARLRAVEKQT